MRMKEELERIKVQQATEEQLHEDSDEASHDNPDKEDDDNPTSENTNDVMYYLGNRFNSRKAHSEVVSNAIAPA